MRSTKKNNKYKFILKSHKELLHPGKEKTISIFKQKFYYPYHPKLIQNILNECKICNIAKSEHRNTKLAFPRNI